ncbi:hypothetical protein ASG90_12655 [Nocardioides sp. Soil797]|nr:hypothetical protein ASG90_12655 [Nocardioides sp. Soil797]
MAGSFVRRSVAALGAIALITALSGCTDDSDADPEASESPSASGSPSETSTSETPSPGPTEPPEPAGMGEPTKKGAELLVRYYFEVADYAQKTGDVKKLRTLSRPGCGSCNNVVSGIHGIHKAGGFIHGGHHTIRSLKVTPIGSGETAGFRVDIQLHSSKQQSRASSRGKVNHVPPAVDPVLFALSTDSDGALKVDFWQIEATS